MPLNLHYGYAPPDVSPKKLLTMKNTKEKSFDTVKAFRAIKEKIAKETEKMTCEKFKEYLNKNRLQEAKQGLPNNSRTNFP